LAADYARGDLVVLETGWDDNPFFYELSLALPGDAPIVRTLPWVDPANIMPVVPQVAETVRQYDRVWLVQWLQPPQVSVWLGEEQIYLPVLAQTISTGENYARLFPDHRNVTLTLYERPDLAREMAHFGEFLALRDAILPERVTAGAALHVDLWWSATQMPELDYSVGVYLMPPRSDAVLAQHDGPPGDTPTSQWSPQMAAPVFDRHTLAVSASVPPGTYRVMARVYWFGDQQPLLADGEALVLLGQVTVE
jgi:hypothetical protein